MRFIIALIILWIPGFILAQDPNLESTLEELESGLTRPGHEADSLENPGQVLPGEYLADSVAISGLDTSYFLAGDPEFNLIRATEFGQLEIVKMLIERGIYVDAATFQGVTPLMFASQNGDVEIMEYLLSNGANVNATPRNNVTALIGAVRTEQYEAAVLLLDSGALVDAKDELELTALMHASAYNYPDIVELLIDNGAGMEKGDWFGSKPLMMAAYYNCIESADVLLEKGADPDGADKNGFTPLMVAVQHGDYDMVWLLIDKGADPGLRNSGGLHALGMAAMKGNTDLAELLLECGADINQNINSSTNALSLVEETDNEEMLEFMLLNGARYNRRPEISELRGGLDLNFNGSDFMLGFELGITENKYKSYLTTGFLARPAAISILRPENDSLSFQLWERRFMWPLTIGKDFELFSDNKQGFGVRVHLTGALTWGSYRGSSLNPGPAFLLMPGAGLYWREKNFGISFDYQYVPLNVHDISNHRLRLSLLGFIDFRSRIKYTRKDISWF